MKPLEYMSKQELQEVNRKVLLSYCIETIGYDAEELEDYTQADLVSVVNEDNLVQRKLAAKNNR